MDLGALSTVLRNESECKDPLLARNEPDLKKDSRTDIDLASLGGGADLGVSTPSGDL